MLLACKIIGFLPLGISFFTFQMISLIADTKNEKVSFKDFCVMSLYFPKLVMGPLVRYKDYKASLITCESKKIVTADGVEKGLRLFTAGMFMKVVIADNLATLWNSINVAGPHGITAATAWLGAATYTIELYTDFFGYSLMAVALGKMMGIEVPENFNEPYSSGSISEFWRRWHITLGTWFKDYIYIPMGGSKKGVLRNILNLLVVWIITGIWHGFGLNFLIWSIMLFAFIVLEKFTFVGRITKVKGLRNVYFIFIIVVSWVVFAISDTSTLLDYLKCMFFIPIEGAMPATNMFMRFIRTYWYLLVGGVFFMTPVPRILYKKYSEKWWAVFVLTAMFALSVFFILKGNGNVFMYYNF
ncbi:MAG: MBOAT family protein [Lachnospiraceae bacterium]|nr:MBOAT family protein [Lachnospiraceae bacterium]